MTITHGSVRPDADGGLQSSPPGATGHARKRREHEEAQESAACSMPLGKHAGKASMMEFGECLPAAG